MLDINSLEATKKLLKRELTEFSSKPLRTFKTEQEVKEVFLDLYGKALRMGNYAYDPTLGELCWHIGKEHELDVFARIEDDRLIANVVREILEDDGWTKVIVLPPVTGSNRILIKMQSDEIKAGVVTDVISLVKKAIVKKK
jgi:hypothetical protein